MDRVAAVGDWIDANWQSVITRPPDYSIVNSSIEDCRTLAEENEKMLQSWLLFIAKAIDDTPIDSVKYVLNIMTDVVWKWAHSAAKVSGEPVDSKSVEYKAMMQPLCELVLNHALPAAVNTETVRVTPAVVDTAPGIEEVAADVVDIEPHINPKLVDVLKPHQIDGIKFIWSRLGPNVEKPQGCLLADNMGLGKTLQTITFLDIYRRLMPKSRILIISPAVVVYFWIDEVKRWLGDETPMRPLIGNSMLTVQERNDLFADWKVNGGCLFAGYEFIRDCVNDIVEADMIVLDEGHRLRSIGSRISSSIRCLVAPRRLVLTGYPLQNNLMEYYAMLTFISPTMLGSEDAFQYSFAEPIQNGSYSDSSKLAVDKAERRIALLRLDYLDAVVLRRGVDVLEESLPPRYTYDIMVHLTDVQNTLYKSMMSLRQWTGSEVLNLYHFVMWLCSHPRVLKSALSDKGYGGMMWLQSQFDKLSEDDIQSIASGSKMAIAISLIVEAISVGDKVVLFSQSLDILDGLESFIKSMPMKYSRFDGSMPVMARCEIMSNFNKSDEMNLLLVSTLAGGEGSNMVGANRVIMFDTSWNPSHDYEAACRVYRYGQVKPVYVYRLVAAATFETTVYNRAQHKKELFDTVVDGNAAEREFSKAALSDYLSVPDRAELRKEADSEWDSIGDDVLRKTLNDVSVSPYIESIKLGSASVPEVLSGVVDDIDLVLTRDAVASEMRCFSDEEETRKKEIRVVTVSPTVKPKKMTPMQELDVASESKTPTPIVSKPLRSAVRKRPRLKTPPPISALPHVVSDDYLAFVKESLAVPYVPDAVDTDMIDISTDTIPYTPQAANDTIPLSIPPPVATTTTTTANPKLDEEKERMALNRIRQANKRPRTSLASDLDEIASTMYPSESLRVARICKNSIDSILPDLLSLSPTIPPELADKGVTYLPPTRPKLSTWQRMVYATMGADQIELDAMMSKWPVVEQAPLKPQPVRTPARPSSSVKPGQPSSAAKPEQPSKRPVKPQPVKIPPSKTPLESDKKRRNYVQELDRYVEKKGYNKPVYTSSMSGKPFRWLTTVDVGGRLYVGNGHIRKLTSEISAAKKAIWSACRSEI